MKKTSKTVLLTVVLIFIVFIVFILSGIVLPKRIDKRNAFEETTYQSVEIKNIQADTEYSYIAIDFYGTRQELEITNSLVKKLYDAKNTTSEFDDVKFIAEGILIVKFTGDNNEYEYGKYYIDDKDNRYIKAADSEGILKLN